MSAELTKETCVDVAEAIGLPHPGVVEKDFYVTQALRLLAGINYENNRLIFGGGTSLCRAYRLIKRMSEDIDFRIASATPLNRKGRRAFRSAVTERLLNGGFEFDEDKPEQLSVLDEGKTFVYNLPYKTLWPEGIGVLRSGVKVEVSSWPLQKSPVERSVSSLIAQATNAEPEVASISCVDITETAADKFVALTRRIGEECLNGSARDRTLLRHAYDLHHVRNAIQMDDLGAMLRHIMESDRKTRGKKFAAYADDPITVSVQAIKALGSDKAYAQAFDEFQRDMVYGDKVAIEACVPTLREMAALMKA